MKRSSVTKQPSRKSVALADLSLPTASTGVGLITNEIIFGNDVVIDPFTCHTSASSPQLPENPMASLTTTRTNTVQHTLKLPEAEIAVKIRCPAEGPELEELHLSAPPEFDGIINLKHLPLLREYALAVAYVTDPNNLDLLSAVNSNEVLTRELVQPSGSNVSLALGLLVNLVRAGESWGTLVDVETWSDPASARLAVNFLHSQGFMDELPNGLWEWTAKARRLCAEQLEMRPKTVAKTATKTSKKKRS